MCVVSEVFNKKNQAEENCLRKARKQHLSKFLLDICWSHVWDILTFVTDFIMDFITDFYLVKVSYKVHNKVGNKSQ